MARSRYRSVTYHLDASIELARAVDRAGGQTDMATVASALSYSGTRNGAFLTRLANARLFGLVAGRSGQVTLTDRGRRCLSVHPDEARGARSEACLAVPLFRDVLVHFSGSALPDVAGLAELLEREFGESPTRSSATARALADSVRQAGVVSAGGLVPTQVSRLVTNFTDSDLPPRSSFAPQVGWRSSPFFTRARGPRQRGTSKGGHTMVDQHSATPDAGDGGSDPSGLWIDEGQGSGRRASGLRGRRTWVTVAAAACLLAVGVPVGLLVSSGSAPPATHGKIDAQLSAGVAKKSVLAALSATTDSGSFAFSYQLTQSPGTATTTTTLPACGIDTAGPCGTNTDDSTSVTGSGIIDANPMAMAVSASINGGLQVGVRVDPTTVWLTSNDDNGLTPVRSDVSGPTYVAGPGVTTDQVPDQVDSGTPLPSFASITESTLGQRAGAVAMMGMASPTGYLNLVAPAVSSATEVGASTVDGVSVTQYALTIDPSSLATAPGVTDPEATTITAALGVLNTAGMTSIKDLVSIDASGFIRESASTVSFTDGGTVTLDGHLSNFGCAGTLLMPNQPGVSTPPANCTTADTGQAPTTSTTTSTTAPTGSTTSTTAPDGSSTTTTTGGSTTTTTLGSTGSTDSTTTTTVVTPTTTTPTNAPSGG
jgi:hypothetical protein